jgi:hypothetical protein
LGDFGDFGRCLFASKLVAGYRNEGVDFVVDAMMLLYLTG